MFQSSSCPQPLLDEAGRRKKHDEAEKRSEDCADNTGSASFILFSSFLNTPLTPVAWEGYSCILRCRRRPVKLLTLREINDILWIKLFKCDIVN